ncbi:MULTISPECIES: hypothetical protein [Catenuloplanes]|uniref:Preprotein translocase subunit SecB n=1 Tax=Catenuloplanes niger TaxID=587534 RepID=A0AAE3ZR18_9ACTN|nr:hypothetical protein [Catenuloplanes niger]MDR7322673.1 hypothetical protein [Catenuloplanes niger]
MTDNEDLGAAQRRAARVAAMADLRDIRLFRAVVEFDHFPQVGTMSWDLEMTPVVRYETGDDFFVLDVDYAVKIEEGEDEPSGDEEGSKQVAMLEFKLAALYSLEVPSGKPVPTSDELEAYAKTAGTLAVYPYAREFAQNLTARMGIPPLTLSTLRLPYPEASPSADLESSGSAETRKRPPVRRKGGSGSKAPDDMD